jgi:hypothetical protein
MKTLTTEIVYAAASAQLMLEELTMRTPLLLALTLSACVSPIGEREHEDFGADAGVGRGSATGCDDLQIVTMNLTVSGTSAFTGLPTSCWKLNGKLVVTGPAVTSLAKLGDLREVTDLELDDSELTKLDMSHPLDVSGDIYIHNNDKLTDLSGVAAKSTVKSIRVEYNPLLTNLGGLKSATIVAGATTIANNSKLSTIDLPSAQRLEGGLTISDNGSLTSIGIPALQSTGAITIARNPQLTAINASSALTQVHSTFTLDDNDGLTTLGQFGTGTTFSSGVSITGNLKLSSLGALSHTQSVLGIISINNNSALDFTYAHEVACCVTSGGFTAQNNLYQDCEGGHWCQNQHNCYR